MTYDLFMKGMYSIEEIWTSVDVIQASVYSFIINLSDLTTAINPTSSYSQDTS